MANTKQSEKRAKQALKRRSANMSQRSELRTAVKKARTAAAAGGEGAAKLVSASVSVIDKIAAKGIIHKNKAARTKSRLAKQLKATAKAA